MRYVATKTFQIGIENNSKLVTIHEGIDIVDEKHEFYRRFPENWKPVADAPVEQATAAPGEKRKRGSRMRKEVETPDEPAPDEPAPEGDEE